MPQPTKQELWESQIRQPAEHAKEGKRKLQEGPASAEYQLAPLPDGRWAVRVNCVTEGSAGMNIPWRAFPTREECVSFFLDQARAFFEREKNLKKGREMARRKMAQLLAADGLFGWTEPEPEEPRA